MANASGIPQDVLSLSIAVFILKMNKKKGKKKAFLQGTLEKRFSKHKICSKTYVWQERSAKKHPFFIFQQFGSKQNSVESIDKIIYNV